MAEVMSREKKRWRRTLAFSDEWVAKSPGVGQFGRQASLRTYLVELMEQLQVATWEIERRRAQARADGADGERWTSAEAVEAL